MSPFELIGQALAGWLLADLITGTFHWWEDRIGREDMPLIGGWIVAPNRLHHSDPLAFLRGSLFDRSLATMVAAALVGAAWCLLFGPSVLLAAAVIGSALVNEVHRFAHEPKAAGAFLRVLQDIGLIQSSKHHAGHHRPPSTIRYCVLTDWLNPLLDALRVWERLEAGLQRCRIVRVVLP